MTPGKTGEEHSPREIRMVRDVRVLVVGSGWRFTSGISYYTCRLTNALAAVTPTSALLMRQLVPTSLYPGRSRVGQVVNDVDYAKSVSVLDGVDWFWGKSMRRARRFLDREQPDVVVLQWWTGAVLHSYVRLAALAKRRGAKVVMEWHEVQDTGEARVPGVVRYVRKAMRGLLHNVDAHVVHSAFDLSLLETAYGLDASTATVVPHGPYDHVQATRSPASAVTTDTEAPEAKPFNVLFFGVIRPYKGLEDLVEAFSSLPQEERSKMHLTIVGETWEGHTGPLTAVVSSPAREQITVVNRYVSDAEVERFFADADAVALPYLRSSSSGPLHMAMSAGLPTIVTAVGGLVEAAGDYEGATFVPPRNPAALAKALLAVRDSRGSRFKDPHSWRRTITAYNEIFAGLGVTLPVQDTRDSAYVESIAS